MPKPIIERIPVGEMQANCYLFGCPQTGQAVIIDPGSDYERIAEGVKKHKLKPLSIINTHGHFDHIGCNDRFNVTVMIHAKDHAFLLDPRKNLSYFLSRSYAPKNEVKLLRDDEVIKIGNQQLTVLHTPGHTPGSICLRGEGIIFTGDTLFFQGIGRTDFPYGDGRAILNSIRRKLLTFPDDTVIYPGHGPESTIGAEKKHNPYVEETA